MEYHAYSFDLDDNLLVLPTKVILLDKEGNKKEFTTQRFEKIRNKLDKMDLKIFKGSFYNFENNEQFYKDLKKAKKAKSWKYLIDCIVIHASIFAIITARGQEAETIKKGLKEEVLKELTKEQLKNFMKIFQQKFKQDLSDKKPEEVLDIYFDQCKFYPCSNPSIWDKYGREKTISDLKAVTFRDFRKYLESYLKQNFDKPMVLKIGFSDDSTAHLSSIANSVLKDYGFFFFHTKKSGVSEFISSYY